MNKKIRAICVVAHPDDETIWMGGTILKNPDWDWTIFSLCRAGDSDRAPKFARVCEFYGANSIISDLDDEVCKPLSGAVVKKKILAGISGESYDYIYTHGENGEYGHVRHTEIHNAVKELVAEGALKCKDLYFFDYKLSKGTAPLTPDLKIPKPARTSEVVINLSLAELRKKRRIVADIHGYPRKGFEVYCCNRREAFSLA